ncbi:MAG: hypothetical protein ABR507_11420 [Actinomycetota bacterium]|nr:hypothetical protein [Actinomycetota bacterium]
MAEAPEYIKDAFQHWVEGWGWESKERHLYPYNEIVYDVGDKNDEWQLTRLLGKLWKCTEVMPNNLCDRLDIEHGSTYAKAAQMILARGRRGKYTIPLPGFRVPPD